MSDATIQAIIIAIPATLGAIGSLATVLIGLANGRKADVISGHVDGAATTSVAKIEGLQATVELLHTVIAKDDKTAALLAQATLTAKRPPASPPDPPRDPSVDRRTPLILP